MGRLNRCIVLGAASLLILAANSAIGKSDPVALNSLSKTEADECSSLVLDNAGQAIFATNLDGIAQVPGMIFINRRGVMKTGLNPSTTGAYAEWRARYGSISFSLIGYQHVWAGMNERGLALSTMALVETVNQPPDHRPPLGWMWCQYILDTCETVADVIATEAVVRNYTVDHHLLVDRFGDVAVIEFLDSGMVVHSGSDLCASALTNSLYAGSCAAWEMRRETRLYSDYGGSLRRFCRAADRVVDFTPVATEDAVAYAYDALRTIYLPNLQGVTQWSIVFDTQNLRTYFKSQRTPEIRWVDLDAFDLHCSQPPLMLDLDVEHSGNVSRAFTAYDSDRNRAFREAYFDRWNIPENPAEISRQLEHIESYPCLQPFRRPTGRQTVRWH